MSIRKSSSGAMAVAGEESRRASSTPASLEQIETNQRCTQRSLDRTQKGQKYQTNPIQNCTNPMLSADCKLFTTLGGRKTNPIYGNIVETASSGSPRPKTTGTRLFLHQRAVARLTQAPCSA